MRALAFWKTVTEDRAGFLESLVSLLAEHKIRYCVIGGVAVNAYLEPVVTLDLDIVVAVEQMKLVESLLAERFDLERFPYSLNVSMPGSKLRVQIQTDPCFAGFVERASPREVLELTLPVTSIEDLLQAKIWATREPRRRASKRQKDLADIARILEGYPRLRAQVPDEILNQLVR